MQAFKRAWGPTMAAMLLLVALSPPAAWADRISDARAEERLDLKSLTYRASLGRDPFSLPDFAAEALAASADELNITMAKLVGVVETPAGWLALVEDENGESYTLRENDSVLAGRVTEIKQDRLVAWVRFHNVSQRIQLSLGKEGE